MNLLKRSASEVSLFTLGVILFTRILPDPLWRLLPPSYSYVFEALIIVGFILASQLMGPLFKTVPLKRLFLLLGGSVVAGAILSGLLIGARVDIPFNVHSMEMVFLLLVVGPLLEELLYRHVLWESLKTLFSARATLIITTLVFAEAHLVSLAFVPSPYQAFILYQTVYVAGLGWVCGKVRENDKAITSPYAVHFGFNLGFFLILLSQSLS